MNRCCVISCLNKRSEKQFKFFKFPSDPSLCLQWVEFCHCPETTERFASGGPFALQKFVICSEHFDTSDIKDTTNGPSLLQEAVPINIGRTYMTPEMLMERGFNVEVRVKQEESEQNEQLLQFSHIPDEVVVEMIDPDDIKQEQMETQIKQEPEEDNPLALYQMAPRETQLSSMPELSKNHLLRKNDNNSLVPPSPQSQVKCKGICIGASRFRERYELEIAKNKRLEKRTEELKKQFAEKVGRMQKIEDLLELKKQKKDRLKEKYQQLKIQYKKGIVLTSAQNEKEIDDDDDDADFDEANAWW